MRKRRVFLSFPETGGTDASLLKSQKVIEGVNIRTKMLAVVIRECLLAHHRSQVSKLVSQLWEFETKFDHNG